MQTVLNALNPDLLTSKLYIKVIPVDQLYIKTLYENFVKVIPVDQLLRFCGQIIAHLCSFNHVNGLFSASYSKRYWIHELHMQSSLFRSLVLHIALYHA